MKPDDPPEVGDRQKAGLTGAEYKVWLKRNRTETKGRKRLTDAQWRFAVKQRRAVEDQLRDLERRAETRWDR